jgi:hypothetical protein
MANFTFVQSGGTVSSGQVTTLTAPALASSVTPGDLVTVKIIGFSSTLPTLTVFDNKTGNTYVADLVIQYANFYFVAIYRCVITNGGTGFQITVVPSHSSYVSFGIDEHSFTGTLSVDGTPIAANGTSTAANSGSITLSGTDLFIGVICLINTATPTVGSGFTARYSHAYASGTSIGILVEDNVADANATDAATFSLSASQYWAVGAVAYKATVSTPTLTVSPTSATVALNGTHSITPTLTNSSAALTASSLHGSVPGSVTSGVAFTYTAPSSGTADTVTVIDSTDSLTAPCSITLTSSPTLTILPTSATVALNGTQSVTATLANSSAALTATALYGTVPGSVTSGTPFTYTAPASGVSDTVEVFDSTDSLTATCSITLVPVAITIAFMSFAPVGIFPPGQAASITVTPEVCNGTAIVTPGTATVGAVLEVTVSSVGIGAYWCMITYHTTDLTIPNVPSVIWTYAGQSFVDAGPAGLVQLNLSQPVATGGPSQTVGGGLNAALAGAAGAINWTSTAYTISNTDSTVFRTFTTNVAAPTGGLAPTTRV